MPYVLQVLTRFNPGDRGPGRRKWFVERITCGYCGGTGVDPKFGNASRCLVCGAAGQVPVKPPVVRCLRCGGHGRAGGDLLCMACRGVGAVAVRPEAEMCPRCRGRGEEGVFYCHFCKGQGIV